MKVLSDKQRRKQISNRKYLSTEKGKKQTHICQWICKGLVDDYDKVYDRYDKATCCELCSVSFTIAKKNMDHDHTTKLFRNVVCTKCNVNKSDVAINSNNKTGYKNIYFNKHRGSWYYRKTFMSKKYQFESKDKSKVLAAKFAYILLLKY